MTLQGEGATLLSFFQDAFSMNPRFCSDQVQVLESTCSYHRLLQVFACGRLSRIGLNQGKATDRRILTGRNCFRCQEFLSGTQYIGGSALRNKSVMRAAATAVTELPGRRKGYLQNEQ